MRLELSQATFERLVRLYLLSLGLSLAAAVYETMSPAWSGFSDGFDALLEASFGTPDENVETAILATALAALVWHLSSTFGLLSFKRWARSGFWMSILFLLLIESIPPFSTATYSGSWSNWTVLAEQALFGAILLLAYAPEHGEKWFMRPLDKLREIF